MEALIRAVRDTPSIRVLEGFVVEELITRGATLRVRRVIARPNFGKARNRITFPARAWWCSCSGGHRPPLYAGDDEPVERAAAASAWRRAPGP